MALFALYPQFNLRQLRGADYRGAFASCDLDEMAYASYLQALADGRPRLNDPYTGRDDSPSSPQPESLFSIQFFPAYLVAIPARIFGISITTMMPIVSAFSAFFTVLALFWLIVSITKDSRMAAIGALAVAVGSALISGIGAANALYEGGVAYPFFPFMRRHIPSATFPFFFAFYACLWSGLKAPTKKKQIVYSTLTSLCFAATVFSYFYLWTSAAASLACLTALILIFREENWQRDFKFLLITGAICLLSLAPYAILLANRSPTTDKAQLLVFTRQPDLQRYIAIVGYFILLFLAFAAWKKITEPKDKIAFFIAALALSPFVVFNQQILTGRSLQPFHYEFYSLNYVVALAVVLLLFIYWQQILSNRKIISAILLVVFALVTTAWGYFEAKETTALWDDVNIVRDDSMPVNRQLRQLADEARAKGENPLTQTTLNFNSIQGDSQPTVAPQPVLWARHQHVFAGITGWDENKERYYQLLYYADLDENYLRTSLTGCSEIEACMVLFGWDRFNTRLSANARPLTQPEIEAEIQNFAEYRKKFSRAQAANPALSYLVVHSESANAFINLDRWYERDAGEIFGKYKLYRLNLRDNPK